MHRHHHQRLLSRRRARGVTLIDALIALVILSFGLIGMTRLQTRALSQATESQERLRAAVFVDQMLSSVIVDAGNRDCYRVPAGGTCGSTTASTFASNWKTEVEGNLPNGTATSVLNGNQLTVTVTWTGKESQVTRTHQGITDVRTTW